MESGAKIKKIAFLRFLILHPTSEKIDHESLIHFSEISLFLLFFRIRIVSTQGQNIFALPTYSAQSVDELRVQISKHFMLEHFHVFSRSSIFWEEKYYYAF